MVLENTTFWWKKDLPSFWDSVEGPTEKILRIRSKEASRPLQLEYFSTKAAYASSQSSMGRVEELLVAEELWNDHKKPFFFPFSSAATCTNHSLEIDRSLSETK
ncbi:hypothetical protein Taro_023968 [Colocasia esculenta]|uniref:Uncharacterized protein n=1 Tax=Colocasia esculenta TaxID=4460 RepID=A0A843V660_COLES|nr:hypothetical protein [Colocasia esculenta]